MLKKLLPVLLLAMSACALPEGKHACCDRCDCCNQACAHCEDGQCPLTHGKAGDACCDDGCECCHGEVKHAH